MFKRLNDWIYSKSELEIQAMWAVFVTTLSALAIGCGYLIDFWPVGQAMPDLPIFIVGVIWYVVLIFSFNVLLMMAGISLSVLVLVVGENKAMEWLDKFID